MNCIFCHERPGGRRLTLEHVFSKPVRRSFDIADDTQIGRIDDQGVIASFARADQFAVRLPCGSCNSGWMSTLEVEMVKSIRSWQRSPAACARSRSLAIKRWSLKTYIVLSAIEAEIRKPTPSGETPSWRVIPEATRAPLLAVGDSDAFTGVRIGASRVRDAKLLYGFGNPEVRSPHGGIAPNISAGASFVTLGDLRLWTVLAFDRSADIRLPPGVVEIGPHLRYQRLRWVPERIGISDAVVLNSPDLDTMATIFGSD